MATLSAGVPVNRDFKITRMFNIQLAGLGNSVFNPQPVTFKFK
jgi:hypothetical protein